MRFFVSFMYSYSTKDTKQSQNHKAYGNYIRINFLGSADFLLVRYVVQRY